MKKTISILLMMSVVLLFAEEPDQTHKKILPLTPSARVIHVVVALCDNENQGIMKVPKAIGNGQKPATNLYWGCQMGVKSFFKKHPDWKSLTQIDDPKEHIYERLVFHHKKKDVYLIADAYDGKFIKTTITDFFKYSAGQQKETLDIKGISIGIGGNADLVAYVGHDGLMEFSLDEIPRKSDNKKRDAIMLSCASKHYFSKALKESGAYPILWTTDLMAPEAYSLSAAIDGWILNETGEQIKERAAQSYNKYQKCGIKGARNLFATGW